MTRGKIVRIAGPVMDIRLEGHNEPPINGLLKTNDGGIHFEIAQHVQPGLVRCIAMEATEGICCGIEVEYTGGGITAPVGESVLGRLVDSLGRPIDGTGDIDAERWEVPRDPPRFED
mgnify:CR=1 FL=1